MVDHGIKFKLKLLMVIWMLTSKSMSILIVGKKKSSEQLNWISQLSLDMPLTSDGDLKNWVAMLVNTNNLSCLIVCSTKTMLVQRV
jgi:hypothetical protein